MESIALGRGEATPLKGCTRLTLKAALPKNPVRKERQQQLPVCVGRESFRCDQAMICLVTGKAGNCGRLLPFGVGVFSLARTAETQKYVHLWRLVNRCY